MPVGPKNLAGKQWTISFPFCLFYHTFFLFLSLSLTYFSSSQCLYISLSSSTDLLSVSFLLLHCISFSLCCHLPTPWHILNFSLSVLLIVQPKNQGHTIYLLMLLQNLLFIDNCISDKVAWTKKFSIGNKTGLQPVSKPVEQFLVFFYRQLKRFHIYAYPGIPVYTGIGIRCSNNQPKKDNFGVPPRESTSFCMSTSFEE